MNSGKFAYLRLCGLAVAAAISFGAFFPASGAVSRILGLYNELRQQARLIDIRERQAADLERNKSLADGFVRPRVVPGSQIAQMLVEADNLGQQHGLAEAGFEITGNEVTMASDGLRLSRTEFSASLTGAYADAFGYLLSLAKSESYFQIDSLRMSASVKAPDVLLEISCSVFAADELGDGLQAEENTTGDIPPNPFRYGEAVN